jgi:adenosine kinase
MPYVDVLFCNEAEAEAWATAIGHPAATDLPAVAKAIAALPKSNPSRPRLVVITHGAEPTIVINGASADVKEYPVHVLKETDIVDTNGAGDAFAGAFMAALVAGKDLDAAVAAGQKLAASCIQEVRSSRFAGGIGTDSFLLQSGPQFKWPKVQIFE